MLSAIYRLELSTVCSALTPSQDIYIFALATPADIPQVILMAIRFDIRSDLQLWYLGGFLANFLLCYLDLHSGNRSCINCGFGWAAIVLSAKRGSSATCVCPPYY
jgi:hypothetical protein